MFSNLCETQPLIRFEFAICLLLVATWNELVGKRVEEGGRKVFNWF